MRHRRDRGDEPLGQNAGAVVLTQRSIVERRIDDRLAVPQKFERGTFELVEERLQTHGVRFSHLERLVAGFAIADALQLDFGTFAANEDVEPGTRPVGARAKLRGSLLRAELEMDDVQLVEPLGAHLHFFGKPPADVGRFDLEPLDDPVDANDVAEHVRRGHFESERRRDPERSRHAQPCRVRPISLRFQGQDLLGARKIVSNEERLERLLATRALARAQNVELR